MDITCWNCKTITNKLDKVAVEAAITQMDAARMGFHDVICPNCGKTNCTARNLFDAALKAYAVVEPQLPKRELARKTKEENARHSGENVGKATKKGRK
jgi:bacterioferritin-associated ferredoxin